MSVVVQLKPTAVLQDGVGSYAAVRVVNTADKTAAVADELDTTAIYADPADLNNNGRSIIYSVEDITLPSRARVEWVRVRMRSRFDASPKVTEYIRLVAGPYDGVTIPSTYVDLLTPHSSYVGNDGTYVDVIGVNRAYRLSDNQVWDNATINSMALLVSMFSNSAGTGGFINTNRVRVELSYDRCPVVSAVGPFGTATSFYPSITWTYVDDDGFPQERYQVRVYTSAQVAAGGFSPYTTTPVWDSGEVFSSSARSAQVGVQLTDGASYVAYVRSSQPWSGGGGTFWSEWARTVNGSNASTTFTVSVNHPTTPSISRAVADPENGRIWIEVTDGGGSPAATWARIESSDDGGVTWKVLRYGGAWPYSGGKADLYDYEIHSGETQYRAASVGSSSGVYLTSPYSVASSVNCFLTKAWLRDPVFGYLYNLAAPIALPFAPKRREAQGVYEPLGRTKAVVMGDGRRATKADMLVWAIGAATYDALVGILNLGRTLRLDLPTGETWYLRPGEDQTDERIVTTATADDPDHAVAKAYKIGFSWIEVDRPYPINIGLLTPS